MGDAQGAGDKPRRGLFYRIRVGVLLSLLVVVLVYAANDVRRRRARTHWKRTLFVSIVVVHDGSVAEGAVEALRARAPTLEQRLADEMARHRPAALQPFSFEIVGPVVGTPPPADEAAEPGLVSSAEFQWALHRWTRDIDARSHAMGAYDTRIYMYATRPERADRNVIEGLSEAGGWIGVVRVELDASMADFALFVAAHETLHTLGATDKYSAEGTVLVPDGLAEPERAPLYPQRFAEVMARQRATGPASSKPPASLAELTVGQKTAEEIGWLR